MNSIARFSDNARGAFYWGFLCALREQQKQMSLLHLLIGLQAANPKILPPADLKKMGFEPLDISDLSQIQSEMQKLQMQSQLEAAQEGLGAAKDSARAWGFGFPLLENAKAALRAAASCADAFGTRSIGAAHLLHGIFVTDAALAEKLRGANWTDVKIQTLCREYRDEQEGTVALDAFEMMRPRITRCGIGYDLHRLEAGRKLIVGGIELPFDKGPVGHSDGDVLAHALCDALLGAAGLGDIGTHFPDTDPKWKGANSLLFLEHARKLLDEKRIEIEHVDAVVILERPKLGPHFPKMREALAKSLGVSSEKIHLKAKTNEGVDAVGRGEAIACHVAATLVSR